MKKFIPTRRVHCVYGYIRMQNENETTSDIINLILLFYAKPIFMNLIDDHLKSVHVLYDPLRDNWESMRRKIREAYCEKHPIYDSHGGELCASNFSVKRLYYKNERIKKKDWDDFRWDEEEEFAFHIDSDWTSTSEDYVDSDEERLQELESKIGHRPTIQELIAKNILHSKLY